MRYEAVNAAAAVPIPGRPASAHRDNAHPVG
jgi:hypothetical protein